MPYGYGLHRCIGKPIADVQITQTMKALLRRPNLRALVGELKVKRFVVPIRWCRAMTPTARGRPAMDAFEGRRIR